MKRWIGAALVAGAVAFAGLPAIGPVAAASLRESVGATAASKATEFSARRHYRRDHPYGTPPLYYARPYYYRPYPYSSPAPFTFGFGFGPWWWW
jgi:hypothetical protein